MSTPAAASKLHRFTNIPLHTLLRSATTNAAVAGAATAGAQLFIFNTTNTPNPQTPEEFKSNGQRETFFLQRNGFAQNPLGFTVAVDQSKAEILCRRSKVVDNPPTEDEDNDLEENGDDDDDDDDNDGGCDDAFDDDGDFSDSEDEIEVEDVKPRKRL